MTGLLLILREDSLYTTQSPEACHCLSASSHDSPHLKVTLSGFNHPSVDAGDRPHPRPRLVLLGTAEHFRVRSRPLAITPRQPLPCVSLISELDDTEERQWKSRLRLSSLRPSRLPSRASGILPALRLRQMGRQPDAPSGENTRPWHGEFEKHRTVIDDIDAIVQR